MKINLFLKNVSKLCLKKTGLAFSGFMLTNFSSRCLCSELSTAGSKDLFSLHTKLLAPVPALGRSSEECSLLMLDTEITVSSLYKTMVSFQNQSKLLHDASWTNQPVAL